jgi:N-acyl-L-homoserine lactone synthetase
MVNFTNSFGHLLPKKQQKELFQYRYKVFIESLGWEISTKGNIETDEFDHEQTCYVIAKDNKGEITGCSRLLPTTRPYLLECIFPILLNGKKPPKTDDIWELSRFTSMNLANECSKRNSQMTSNLTQNLLWESLLVAKNNGAKGVISVSPLGIERLLQSMGIVCQRLGKPMMVNGYKLFACFVDFKTIDNFKQQCA